MQQHKCAAGKASLSRPLSVSHTPRTQLTATQLSASFGRLIICQRRPRDYLTFCLHSATAISMCVCAGVQRATGGLGGAGFIAQLSEQIPDDWWPTHHFSGHNQNQLAHKDKTLDSASGQRSCLSPGRHYAFKSNDRWSVSATFTNFLTNTRKKQEYMLLYVALDYWLSMHHLKKGPEPSGAPTHELSELLHVQFLLHSVFKIQIPT